MRPAEEQDEVVETGQGGRPCERTSGLGKAIFFLAGIPMYLFEIYWFYQWWDVIGVVASVFLPPLAAVFPFIYVLKEGFDQGAMLYFGIWGIGLLGLAASVLIDVGRGD